MSYRRQMTPDERQCVLDMAAMGWNLNKIASEVGFSRYSVKALVDKHNGADANGKPWTEHDDAILRECAAAGLTTRDACVRLHRTMRAIESRASTIGVSFGMGLRPNSAPKPLPPGVAARNYAAVAHRLDRLRFENVHVAADPRRVDRAPTLVPVAAE